MIRNIDNGAVDNLLKIVILLVFSESSFFLAICIFALCKYTSSPFYFRYSTSAIPLYEFYCFECN